MVFVSVVTFLAGLSSVTGYNLRGFFPNTSNKPIITCNMEYPIKVENDKALRDKRNPEIIISNQGPVSALSVSGNVKVYQYDSQNHKINSYVYQNVKHFDHAFSKKKIEPFDELRHTTIGIHGESVMLIYIVDIVYHVGAEMEQFKQEHHFFLEDKEIKDETKFAEDGRYDLIKEKLKYIDSSTLTGIKVISNAIGENTWYIEKGDWFSARKGDDGTVSVIGPPEDQKGTKINGYPFIELTPHPFKDTGYFYEATIIGDYVELKATFVVANTGDADAFMTDDGFKIVKIIQPGQTEYYTQTVKMVRMEGIKEPHESLMKLIDDRKESFEMHLDIYYRPANDHQKLLKVSGHYYFRNTEVVEIK